VFAVSRRDGFGLVLFLLATFCSISAQVEFDSASVKESRTVASAGTMRLMPGGGVMVQHLPARTLITVGYQLQPYQVVGAPDWTRSTYYDIIAKPAAASSRAQTFEMMQALLADRFAFRAHREQRTVDGYVLVRVRPDELGPALKVSSVDCEKDFATMPRCRQGSISATAMQTVGAPMWNLLQFVISMVNAPVNDETMLTGTYDFELRWSNEVAPADGSPTLFLALQDQLGLKLERRRVQTDVLVVDRIERPAPDWLASSCSSLPAFPAPPAHPVRPADPALPAFAIIHSAL
jgi:uncharacterized protein (TIGR03435 family)